MRIEINAGGLGAGAVVAEYQWNMSGFISDAESVISSFKAVNSKVYDLNGGVGSLQSAVDAVSERIRQEEEKKAAAVTVQKKSNDFLDLAIRVDKQVAILVDQNRDEFYKTNPWLKPAVAVDDTPWYQDVWYWLCDMGEGIAEGAEAVWEWTKDTAKKAWDGLVEFYNEHKKIIDTVLIVVGAIAAIAAVVATGGVALVPLLGALGLSTTAAIAISTAVAVVAVVSTVASSALNIVDTWVEIDDPTFNAWQKGLNIVGAVSNLSYSIGTIYNSVKHIDPTDYLAQSTSKQPPKSLDVIDAEIAPNVELSPDPFANGKAYSRGNNYSGFEDYWTNLDGYQHTRVDSSQIQYVKARDIEGVYLFDGEIQNPKMFWSDGGDPTRSMDTSIKIASKIDDVRAGLANGVDIHDLSLDPNIGKTAQIYFNRPVEVAKLDSFFVFGGDGRHRILAAQSLDIEIPVIVTEILSKL